MIKIIHITAAAMVAFVASASTSGLNPHPVSRVRTGDDNQAVYYTERLSDGSSRSSKVAKPTPPEYPHQVTIIATNETPKYYELIYAARYDNGRIRTNSQVILKSQRDIINSISPPMPELPAEPLDQPAPSDALSHAKARIRQSRIITTNNVMRMAPRTPRVVSKMVVGDRVVSRLDDGTDTITPITRAYTARVTAANRSSDVVEPTGDTNSGGSPSGAAALVTGLAVGAAAVLSGRQIFSRKL